jgi:Zn finger protein HypA/HybF involved in hydrogenase expression
MGLFGFGKKESTEDELIEKSLDPVGKELVKKSLTTVAGLLKAMQSGDMGEIIAAASKETKCLVCNHEFVVGTALAKSSKVEGFDIKCPKCGKAALSIALKKE